jgi:hypothetical protein
MDFGIVLLSQHPDPDWAGDSSTASHQHLGFNDVSLRALCEFDYLVTLSLGDLKRLERGIGALKMPTNRVH